MIEAIFFATFDVNEGTLSLPLSFHSTSPKTLRLLSSKLTDLTFLGPKIHHQVPLDSICPSASSASIPLFAFPPLAQYIIPAPSLSNRPLQLLTAERPHHRILSHPVTIDGEHYPRNAFTFNFCLVLEEETGFHSYLPVVKKLATLFRDLEEHSQFLTTELSTHGPNEGRIYAICEILLEDLNNYSECMIPIDGTTSTLNIKLFPIYPPPPPLYTWQVPLLTVKLDDMVDSSWDLTMRRILPFINGINSVKRIALLADADLKLTRKALKHLLYYNCLILLDIFSFSAIYAPTPSIIEFVQDDTMQEECARYVSLHSLSIPTTAPNHFTSNQSDGPHPENDTQHRITGAQLAELYLSLHQGQSVKSWCTDHPFVTKVLDIRRFITFGVIKGFLYRVHRYAIANTYTITATTTGATLGKKGNGRGIQQQLTRQQATKQQPPTQPQQTARPDESSSSRHQLAKYLDGTHCFDEICTELMISEKELLARLKKDWGAGVTVVCR